MSKEIEITKIVLNVGKREITLTVDEARSLREKLDGLFGKEVREVWRDNCWHWDYYPRYRLDVSPIQEYFTWMGNTTSSHTMMNHGLSPVDLKDAWTQATDATFDATTGTLTLNS